VIVRLRVDVNANGAVVVFGEIQYLMDGFFKLDLSRKTVRHLKRIGLAKLTVTAGFIDLFDSEVLQSADRNGHPAALLTVIMNARHLTLVPADSHHLETIVLVDKVARIEGGTPEQILLDRIHVDRITTEEFIDWLAIPLGIRDLA